MRFALKTCTTWTESSAFRVIIFNSSKTKILLKKAFPV